MESKKLLLAISGGVDSMVLMDLLSRLGMELNLAHCNFGLRSEDAAKDEALVRSVAVNYGLNLHVIQFDTKAYAKLHRCSVQMAARDLRYQWFEELLKENEYDYLLTAHHADDNMETFFINLSRGTGIDGLCGIPEKSKYILRPLLPFNKEEILSYATGQKLVWREDLSNQDYKYLRNRIRADLIPLLKDLNPSFLETFESTISHLKGSRDIVNDRIKALKDLIIEQGSNSDPYLMRFKVDKLSEVSNNVAYLYQLFHPYGFNQYKDIRSLLSSQSGKQVYSKSHRLVKDRGFLLLSKIDECDDAETVVELQENQKSIALDGGQLLMESIHLTKRWSHERIDTGPETAYFDKDLLTYPLTVRKWEKGDYFYPIGMAGKKKLSKFFKDEKYSLLQKENIWLLCSGTHIIWVIGKRSDNRYIVSDKTKNILKATLNI
ncbi:tRNA lysidine(34) synthetase TilS [Lutimonas vermicola]|uniref:tRNA(Ile)-lysidine synthase n=1 Tax=Lutimonas vermicola TaxID=414288 RepID=A0ABU9L6A3_9FLAO